MSDRPNSEISAAGAAAVAAVARAGEPDRYLAALLSPRPHREALLALAAFSAEIRRIPLLVNEPAMGEIRSQWWRDALTLPPELRAGHPVADAVRAAVHTYRLPIDLLDGLVAAASDNLREGPALDENGLRCRLWKTEGALFALAGRVLALPDSPQAAAGCAASGNAYGMVRLLLDLPRLLARGVGPQTASPLAIVGLTAEDVQPNAENIKFEVLLGGFAAEIRRNLATARQFTSRLRRSERVGFLPLALVEPYLRALERSGPRFLQQGTALAPLTRVCRIATSHLFGAHLRG